MVYPFVTETAMLGLFVGCLLACLTYQLLYLRDGPAQTSVHAATLRWNLQIKLSVSPSHSILTPGQLVPSLTLYCHASCRVATGVPI